MTLPSHLPLLLVLIAALPAAADDPAHYTEHIKPLLRQRCIACHGALKQESGLRLDTVSGMLKGGESGPAITPGNAATSNLLTRVSATDPAERMPPEQEGEPLTAAEIQGIREWIGGGAAAPADERPESDPQDHWAFRPVIRPPVPQVDSAWVRNPIDAFLAHAHQQSGVTPQPEAPRIIQLRRLYLDLIGVPPTSSEISEFERNTSAEYYDDTVQRLLDDPRHGQRWARHWMDVWRYSDWWGLGEQLRNSQPHIWHWRDWIVESLNNDTPYDEMVRLMLAADELHPNDLDKLRATGFLARNYFLFNRPQWMDETVEHVSKGFLGLTLNCTRCHDHKYDPIAQADYYRFRAFFEPYHVRIDLVPGESNLDRDGIPRAFDGVLDAPTFVYVRGDEKQPDTSRAMSPGVPELLAFRDLKIEPVSLPEDAWQPERRPWVRDAHLSAARDSVAAAENALQQSQQKLAAALEQAPDAVASAQADQHVALAALDAARAELTSAEKRAAAMHAKWNGSDTGDSVRAAREDAVRAERQAAVEKARYTVAVAQRDLQAAATDRKESAQKAWLEARDALEKASTASKAEIQATDTYTRFVGAKWTPTRFLSSTKDDDEVTFPATSTGRRSALARWITDRRNPLTARVAVNHIWMRHMGEPLVETVFDFGRKGTPPKHPELLDWLAAEWMESGWSMKHLHRLIVTSSAYRMSSSTLNASDNLVRDPENRLMWRRAAVRLESQVVRDALLALAGTLDCGLGGPPVPAAEQSESTRRSLYFFHSNNDRNLFLTMFDEAPVKDCYRRDTSIVPQQALALSNSALVLDASQLIAKRLSSSHWDDSAFIEAAFAELVGMRPSDAERKAGQDALAEWRALPNSTSEQARAHFIWALINHNDFVTVR